MPYVLNEKDRTNFLYALSDRQAAVTDLPWKMNSPAHFIDIASFNDFLRRFFTDDRPGDREMYIDPDITVSVSEDILQNTALKKYHPAASSSLAGRIRNFSEKIHAHQIGSGIASAVGVFAGSVLIEFLMRILSGYSVFQAIDFRNIYIIFAALLGGFSAGTWAAFFESLLLIIGYRQQHITFMMIFYSIDHMLPILFYFFLGTAIGYRQNRSERLIDFAQHERDAVSEQYEVLTDLYSQAVSKKTEYRNDLLNSRNGFGKIFNAVNQLQSTEPGRIMADAIPVMEDLLSNRTISIYSVFASDPDYARLQVASRDILNKVPRSIKLSDKTLLTDSLQKGEVWFNRDLSEGYPMYVSPILQGGRLIALINIREADFSETSLYYQNLLSIISKLIGNFIATAMSYQQAISDKNFVEGTGYLQQGSPGPLPGPHRRHAEGTDFHLPYVCHLHGRQTAFRYGCLSPPPGAPPGLSRLYRPGTHPADCGKYRRLRGKDHHETAFRRRAQVPALWRRGKLASEIKEGTEAGEESS